MPDQPMQPVQPATPAKPQKPPAPKPVQPQGAWKRIKCLAHSRWTLNNLVTDICPGAHATVGDRTAREMVAAGHAVIIDHNAPPPEPIVVSPLVNAIQVLQPHVETEADKQAEIAADIETTKEFVGEDAKDETEGQPAPVNPFAHLPEDLEGHLSRLSKPIDVVKWAKAHLGLEMNPKETKKHVLVNQVLDHVKENSAPATTEETPAAQP